MPALETVKKFAEKMIGWSRPSKADLVTLVKERKPHSFRFRDDGIIPNHPAWPLIIYRSAVRLPDRLDPAAVRRLVRAQRLGRFMAQWNL